MTFHDGIALVSVYVVATVLKYVLLLLLMPLVEDAAYAGQLNLFRCVFALGNVNEISTLPPLPPGDLVGVETAPLVAMIPSPQGASTVLHFPVHLII
ncbi:hypothetical protein D3C79_1006710 [compost metagenome]